MTDTGTDKDANAEYAHAAIERALNADVAERAVRRTEALTYALLEVAKQQRIANLLEVYKLGDLNAEELLRVDGSGRTKALQQEIVDGLGVAP